MVKYEIRLNGTLVDSCELSGLAFIKFDSACLLGSASLIKVVETGDPVVDGHFQYDCGDWVYKGPIRPPCPSGSLKCKYRRPYETLGLQRNALRVEILPPADRCGWNLKQGRIGGRPDDYHPCRKMTS